MRSHRFMRRKRRAKSNQGDWGAELAGVSEVQGQRDLFNLFTFDYSSSLGFFHLAHAVHVATLFNKKTSFLACSERLLTQMVTHRNLHNLLQVRSGILVIVDSNLDVVQKRLDEFAGLYTYQFVLETNPTSNLAGHITYHILNGAYGDFSRPKKQQKRSLAENETIANATSWSSIKR